VTKKKTRGKKMVKRRRRSNFLSVIIEVQERNIRKNSERDNSRVWCT
jgi:hypothetical protein